MVGDGLWNNLISRERFGNSTMIKRDIYNDLSHTVCPCILWFDNLSLLVNTPSIFTRFQPDAYQTNEADTFLLSDGKDRLRAPYIIKLLRNCG